MQLHQEPPPDSYQRQGKQCDVRKEPPRKLGHCRTAGRHGPRPSLGRFLVEPLNLGTRFILSSIAYLPSMRQVGDMPVEHFEECSDVENSHGAPHLLHMVRWASVHMLDAIMYPAGRTVAN